MKLKSVITHLSVFVLGIVLTVGFFIFTVLPGMAKYMPITDVKFIELSGVSGPVEYVDILEKRYLSSMYLSSPLYFFKRNDGLKINKGLAELGYTPSTHSMFFYNFGPAYNILLDEEDRQAYFEKAYKWAKVAESQGFYWPIMQMITLLDLGKHTDITEHLEKIDGFVKSSSIGGPAKVLAEYFEKQGNQEKAKYYYALSKKIDAEQRPEPACYTIRPFKGL